MMVTLEDIRGYRGLKHKIRELNHLIDTMYEPVGSAPMVSDGAARNPQPGDPTRVAVEKIEEYRELLNDLRKQKEEIEQFVIYLDDKLVSAILMVKYIRGIERPTWAAVERHFYKRTDTDTCRKLVQSYFEKQQSCSNNSEHFQQ